MANLDPSRPPRAARGDVAIVGMACTYPGARNLAEFWRNIVEKIDAVADVSPARWDPDVFYDPRPEAEDKIYSKRGGWIGDSFAFNPLKYGIMPSTVQGAEPDHFLVLRTVYEALEDAGFLDGRLSDKRVSVILGKGNYQGPGVTALMYRGIVTEMTLNAIQGLHPEFDEGKMLEIRRQLRAKLPPMNAEVAAGLIPNICSGRVSNRLDFMGRNFTIDAACASSLIATEIGLGDLLSGREDVILAGGVHIFAHIPFLQVFDAMRAMSLSSQIRPFDASCDGTMSGEGVGILVLKRREDAERDGDRIYALIKGAGSSSDGRAKGVTAPRVEGEELAVRRAFAAADLPPQSLDLIEGHGTGTSVGDAAEVEALRRIFGPTDRGRPYCALGSVKSMIGHAMPAAGAASMIKTALSLYHKTLPPTLHCGQPRPELVEKDSPFYVNTETRPWIRPEEDGPRRAGVNAFGFGGVNAHVILEEYVPQDRADAPSLLRDWQTELVALSAPTREELIAELDRIRGYAVEASGTPLRDLAYTVSSQAPQGLWRLAVVASSLDDLAAKLGAARGRIADGSAATIKDREGIYFFADDAIRQGKIAVLFPGEGSQYLNMLSDLCLHFPVVRRAFDMADGAGKDSDRWPTSAVVFPPPAFTEEQRAADEARLFSIERATESVLTGGGAVYKLLAQLGLKPDMMTGHSAGEWVALAASGVLDIDEFVGSLSRLGKLYERVAEKTEIPRKTMLAVGAGRDKVESLAASIDKTVHIANDNCPHQVVIVVEPADEAAVVERLQAASVFVEKLPYDRGYHTPAFTYICQPLEEYFSSLNVGSPRLPLYCSTTAEPYPADPAGVLERVTNTFSRPLLFRQTIEAMYEDGARIFVEAGPRGNLTAFVDDILRGKPHLAAAVDQFRRPGLVSLNHAVGMLFAAGVELDLAPLYERRSPRRIQFDPVADRVEDPDQAPGVIEVSTCYPYLEAPPPLEPVSMPSPGKEAPRAAVNGAANGVSHGTGKSYASPPAAPAPAASAPPPPQPAPEPAGAGWSIAAESNDGALDSHFRLMEEFLETEEAVMRAYFGSPGTAAAAAPAVARALPEQAPQRPPQPPPPEMQPAALAERSVQALTPLIQEAAPPAPVAEAAPAAAAPSGRSIAAVLLDVVSERTGYPQDMLGLDLDMEADLGIDSIKRVEILGALRESAGGDESQVDMEAVARLKTLREVIGFLEAAPGAAGAPPALAGPTPSAMIRGAETVEEQPGASLTLRCRVSPEEHLYLRDHCLYFPASEWGEEPPAVLAMPQTGSLEMLAEAAARLMPGKRVVGAKSVRSLRWINFEEGGAPVDLLVTAQRTADGEVRTAVRHEAAGPTASPLSEAIIVFADDFPPAPAPEPFELDNARRPATIAGNPYDEHRMFHGASFQGVVDMHAIARNGVAGRLKILPVDRLFRGEQNPTFWIDPFLLDAGGQLAGYWPVEFLDEGFVALPIGLSRITLYRENLAPGEMADCQVRIKNVTARQLVADFDIFDAAGQLWMRIEGWTDWRFYWSKTTYEFWRFSNRAFNGSAVEIGAFPETAVRRIDELDESDRNGLWEDMWMRIVLTRREHEEYQRMPADARRNAWVFRRAAAKDAIRDWALRVHNRALFPADIEILEDADGGLRPAGPWFEETGVAPFVAAAYGDRMAIGAASSSPLGVGVEALSASALEGVTNAERAMASARPGESGALLAGWAAAKAAAASLLRLPADGGLLHDFIHVESVADDGTIAILANEAGRQRRIVAATTDQDNVVIALARSDS